MESGDRVVCNAFAIKNMVERSPIKEVTDAVRKAIELSSTKRKRLQDVHKTFHSIGAEPVLGISKDCCKGESTVGTLCAGMIGVHVDVAMATSVVCTKCKAKVP